MGEGSSCQILRLEVKYERKMNKNERKMKAWEGLGGYGRAWRAWEGLEGFGRDHRVFVMKGLPLQQFSKISSLLYCLRPFAL